MMTDAVDLLKKFYMKTYKKEIYTFVCGDFNAVSRSGIYEYMAKGVYDCLKLNRNEISG